MFDRISPNTCIPKEEIPEWVWELLEVLLTRNQLDIFDGVWASEKPITRAELQRQLEVVFDGNSLTHTLNSINSTFLRNGVPYVIYSRANVGMWVAKAPEAVTPIEAAKISARILLRRELYNRTKKRSVKSHYKDSSDV